MTDEGINEGYYKFFLIYWDNRAQTLMCKYNPLRKAARALVNVAFSLFLMNNLNKGKGIQ